MVGMSAFCYLPLHHKSPEEDFFWHWLIRVVLEKGHKTVCVRVCVWSANGKSVVYSCQLSNASTTHAHAVETQIQIANALHSEAADEVLSWLVRNPASSMCVTGRLTPTFTLRHV